MPGAATTRSATNLSAAPLDLTGKGFIAGIAPGILTVAGAPDRRKIECRESVTGRLVAVTVSARDGTYRLDNLNPARRYYVTAFDHQKVFNAVIRDNITPAVDAP